MGEKERRVAGGMEALLAELAGDPARRPTFAEVYPHRHALIAPEWEATFGRNQPGDLQSGNS